MNLFLWSWHPFTFISLALLVVLYWRGWRRLSLIDPAFASTQRLTLFLVAVGLLVVATISPFYSLGGYYLSIRSLQKVIMCMLAAPLLLLACPFHIIVWGFPASLRRAITRAVLRPYTVRTVLQTVTHSGIAWMLYLATFLIWHEPTFASWSNQLEWTRTFSLWALFYVALLYWWHITYTGPRIHKELPGWVMIVYLVAVEIPNMFTGVSIAFSATPIYEYYRTIQSRLPEINEQLMQLSTLEDQMIGGGLTWVIGSAVYVTAIVMVLNKLFKREKNRPPQLVLSTEPTDRTIAPGLEHRVQQHRWQQSGYGNAKSDNS